jgi:outer membrane murein-binding lipoprotein Lpp
MVSKKSHSETDPLAARVTQVAELVRDLRTELDQVRQDLEQARRRIEALEEERTAVRQRVERMLETIDG